MGTASNGGVSSRNSCSHSSSGASSSLAYYGFASCEIMNGMSILHKSLMRILLLFLLGNSYYFCFRPHEPGPEVLGG